MSGSPSRTWFSVGSAALTNVFVGTEQHVAFGRGSIGFLVINNDATTWTETFTTSLPAGTYCDIIHDINTAQTTCSGPSYVVSSSGRPLWRMMCSSSSPVFRREYKVHPLSMLIKCCLPVSEPEELDYYCKCIDMAS
ncbi:hypothetical protein DFH07DRAFT_543517 [Mycena maculata]|uniref:Alpha-amylase C-terminal domain-containing protein n=1 Tax=Mycena maculata TaxID=230809 RepID=A0AAD7IXW0_9AGAR|nr:hypothetical protein DFH07DRAFT_543517 [Mycena maculata]